MRNPGKTIRPDYDRPEFRSMWHNPKLTLDRIASHYGVSIPSVSEAAMRRGFERRFAMKARHNA